MTVPKLLQQAESLLFGENVQMPEILPIQSQISFTRVYFWLYYLYIRVMCILFFWLFLIQYFLLDQLDPWYTMVNWWLWYTYIVVDEFVIVQKYSKICCQLWRSPESKKATKINWCEQHWTKLSIIIVQNFN